MRLHAPSPYYQIKTERGATLMDMVYKTETNGAHSEHLSYLVIVGDKNLHVYPTLFSNMIVGLLCAGRSAIVYPSLC